MSKSKCAIYCRVSTESQRDANTIESQKSKLPQYAESQGWTIHDVYVDEGISGSFLEGRDDFLRLLADMENREPQVKEVCFIWLKRS
jgi:site-specific DNA recombinase